MELKLTIEMEKSRKEVSRIVLANCQDDQELNHKLDLTNSTIARKVK